MQRTGGFTGLALILIHWALLAQPVIAGDSTEISIMKNVSRPGTVALLTGAFIMPLVTDQGPDAALRNADAMVTAAAVSIGLKQLIDSPRPDGTDDDSFPSSHASVAFAAATMVADEYPEQAPYWYGAATLVAYSRVRLKRHRVRDVLAGAVIGFGIAKLEQELPRGILIAPLLDPETEANGIEISWEF